MGENEKFVRRKPTFTFEVTAHNHSTSNHEDKVSITIIFVFILSLR